METSYVYPNKTVNSLRLLAEINAGGLAMQADYIDTVGGCVSVWFSDALSQADQTTLDAIVAAHVPVTLGEAQTARITQIQLDCETYILARYRQFTVVTLNTIGISASLNGLTNRRNYVLNFTNWFITINAYTANVCGAVSNANSLPAVAAVPFNIAGNTAPDPLVTIQAALAITT